MILEIKVAEFKEMGNNIRKLMKSEGVYRMWKFGALRLRLIRLDGPVAVYDARVPSGDGGENDV